MASPTITMEYWNGSAWVVASDYSGENAVLSAIITKKIANPTKAEVLLINASKDTDSTVVTKTDAASSQGNLNEVFTDYMEVRLRDDATKTYLFRGRINRVANEYDLRLGAVLRVFMQDALQEIGEFPLEDAPRALREIDITHSNYDSRSEIIAHAIAKISDNISTSDTAKFEGSAADLTTNEKTGGGGGASSDSGRLDMSKGNQKALKYLHQLALEDPHTTSPSEHFGYDYYMDHGFASVSTSVKPDAALNYFQRGTRPGPVGAGASDPSIYGIIAEHPASDWSGETDFKFAMKSDASFTTKSDTIYTSAVVHINDEGKSDSNTEGKRKHKVATFELVEGTVTHSGTAYAWEGKSLTYEVDGDTNNPLLLYKQDSTDPCATVHYVSGNGANQYLILGNVYKEDTVVGNIGTNLDGTTFEAFPTGTSSIRFFTSAGLASSNTTQPYFDLVPDTGRKSRSLGINRPFRFNINAGSTSPDAVIKSVATELNKHTRKAVTTAKINLRSYPMVKLTAAAANVTRSTNVIDFGSNAFTGGNGSTQTNNPTLFGVKNGMVIAELDSTSGEIDNYSYISAYDTDSVTYGSGVNDTNGGDALDAGKDIAIYIPCEPGHAMRIKNKIWDKDYNILVDEITYRLETMGALTCYITGVGMENNGRGIAVDALDTDVQDVGNFPSVDKGLQKWSIHDGSIVAINYNQIQVIPSSGSFCTVVLSDGTRYTLRGKVYTVGSATGATYNWHQLFLRPTGPIASPLAVDNKELQIVPIDIATGSATVYSKIADQTEDIVIGRAKADTDTEDGKCALELFGGTVGFSTVQLDIAGIANNRITAALLKKGAQPFTTNIQFGPSDHNGSDLTDEKSLYNAFRWFGPSGDGSGKISLGQHDDQSGNDTTYTVADSTASTSGVSGLSQNTTYYAYVTLPASGTTATMAVTSDYRVPFQDDKILLATIVVEGAPSSDDIADNEKGWSPTILPYNGKVPTLNAVSIAANAITADAIQAKTLTTDKVFGDTMTFTKALNLSGSGALNSATTSPKMIINTSGIHLRDTANTATNYLLFETTDGNNRGAMGFIENAHTYGKELKVIGAEGTKIRIGQRAGSTPHFHPTPIIELCSLIISTRTSGGDTPQHYVFPTVAPTDDKVLAVNTANTIVELGGTLGGSGLSQSTADGNNRATITLGSGIDPNYFTPGYDKITLKNSGGDLEQVTVYSYSGSGQDIVVTRAGSAGSTTGKYTFASGDTIYYSTVSPHVLHWATDDPSSLRFKENVREFDIDTSKLHELSPKRFNIKKDTPTTKKDATFGLIAEEVHEILPELVRYDAEGEPEQLFYSLLSVLLLEEIKKLRIEVDALKNA